MLLFIDFYLIIEIFTKIINRKYKEKIKKYLKDMKFLYVITLTI